MSKAEVFTGRAKKRDLYPCLLFKSMKFLFVLFFLVPCWSFSFSETELEALESEGKKTFSKSYLRREIGLSLSRNLDLNIRHRNFFIEETVGEGAEDEFSFCDFNKKSSFCSLSSLYYKLDFTVYYSLPQWVKKYLNYSILKGTEFFFAGSFNSSLNPGLCFKQKGHGNLKGYLRCGAEDIFAGWTSPIYKKDSFFSYFNFSFIVWPLSQESQNVTVITAFDTSVSLLYFMQKRKQWSWAVSSNHGLVYNHFAKPVSERGQAAYNNPFSVNQQFSLIFKQGFNKYLPANTSLFLLYNLVIDTYKTDWHRSYLEKVGRQSLFTDLDKCSYQTKLGSVIACGNRWQNLALGMSSSWKLAQRVYLKFLVSWKDSIEVHNPVHEKVNLKKKASFHLMNWYFNLRLSYSF